MSDNSNSIKPILRRVRAVPTLLTVPDLRTSMMVPEPSDETILASIEQHVASEYVPTADAFELTTDGQTTTPSEVGRPSELTDTTPSLDELVAAATEPTPTAESHSGFSLNGFSPQWFSAKAKSLWEDRWFGGKFRLEMSTIGTIAATVVACGVVAKAMKPTPTNDFFAAPVAVIDSEAEQPTTTQDGSRIDVAQAPSPVQQPVGSQQPYGNQPYGKQPLAGQPVSGQTQPLAQQPGGQRAWPPTPPLQPNSQLLQEFANEQIASQQMAQAPASFAPNPTQGGYPLHQPTISSQTGGPQFNAPQSNDLQRNAPK